jgi:hypothetical protein
MPVIHYPPNYLPAVTLHWLIAVAVAVYIVDRALHLAMRLTDSADCCGAASLADEADCESKG